MMNIPSRELIEMLRKSYPEGARVKLVHMEDPYSKLTSGTEGTVRVVDDMGTVHVNWDNGSSLGVVFGEDKITRV